MWPDRVSNLALESDTRPPTAPRSPASTSVSHEKRQDDACTNRTV